jgi:cyclopropane-fatty-acyl-phospholipid synthase
MNAVIHWAERGWVPDSFIRWGIRGLLRQKLRAERRLLESGRRDRVAEFADRMRTDPVAISTDQANEQHYEVPTEFFETVLGPYLKYSAGLWADTATTLAESEERMLAASCDRAGIRDGMAVLDLGCGWGSMSLWIARNYPSCRIVAVSNSSEQARFIRGRCDVEGLANVSVETCDMNAFAPTRRFDRVVSVEMFEHMRNWHELFRRISSWLEPGGAFFLHVFCHGELAYHYKDDGPSDWMARNFFTGGIMPSSDLPFHFSSDLRVVRHWQVDGTHYSRTLEAWLDSMDRSRHSIAAIFEPVYGHPTDVWLQRWRIFFMACSELFRFRSGSEWFVSHYLMEPVRGLDTVPRLDTAPEMLRANIANTS